MISIDDFVRISGVKKSTIRKNKDKWKNNKDVSWILKIKFNSLKIYLNFAKNKIKRMLHR